MGKRSDFERLPRDYYRTWDPRATRSLWAHLEHGTRFIEPMAGDGTLKDTLEAKGHQCIQAYDLEPQRGDIEKRDALKYTPTVHNFHFITNPPWKREVLHPIITHLSNIAPTWLLFDSDWAYTDHPAPFTRRLRRIVAVGRVRWIPDSTDDGKDNCSWYLFDKPDKFHRTQFFMK